MYDASRLKMENEIYYIFFIFSAKLVSDMAHPNRSLTSHRKLQDCTKKQNLTWNFTLNLFQAINTSDHTIEGKNHKYLVSPPFNQSIEISRTTEIWINHLSRWLLLELCQMTYLIETIAFSSYKLLSVLYFCTSGMFNTPISSSISDQNWNFPRREKIMRCSQQWTWVWILLWLLIFWSNCWASFSVFIWWKMIMLYRVTARIKLDYIHKTFHHRIKLNALTILIEDLEYIILMYWVFF